MDRRNFFKIVSTVSAGVATNACGSKTNQLIPLLVSDLEIPPGEERWHPSVCGECSAGCGIIVRVMSGERAIERDGEKFRERIACIKKIEGNPLDPVSGGRLCARGHAALQSLYNPDRLRGPLQRKGARGKAEFQSVSWEDAIAAVSEKLAKVHASDPGKILFLSGPQVSARAATIQKFLSALGAPAPVTGSLSSLALERKAAELVFGWKGLPVYDLGQARYALGIGADFLGGWASPVYYARQFGQFRQGRPALRGRLVQAESRMSLTVTSADEWLPVPPGVELQFTIAIARLLLDEKLARNADQLPAAAVDSIQAADLPGLIRASGVDEKRLRRVARELGESEAPLVIAGASVVHSNSLEALTAAHYLNVLLGNISRPGGVLPPNPTLGSPVENANLADSLKRAQVLFLDGENPVYTTPSLAPLLANLELIVSFGNFIDDTTAFADLLLPDHHTLESDLAIVPAVSPRPAITVASAFVKPLYDTRPIGQTLTEIARKMNLPFQPVSPKDFVSSSLPPEQTWDDVTDQGGLWLDRKPEAVPKPNGSMPKATAGAFSEAPEQFPLRFQPYLSLQYHDGRGANLPWMQELPDPVSSSMWSLPLEIDPQTAAQLNVQTGDWVRVESAGGALEAPAYIHPAALPGVVSMAIGEGHTHYGRYASGRGANPLSILPPAWDATGAQITGATSVRIARLERPGEALIQFSPQDRELGPWGHR